MCVWDEVAIQQRAQCSALDADADSNLLFCDAYQGLPVRLWIAVMGDRSAGDMRSAEDTQNARCLRKQRVAALTAFVSLVEGCVRELRR